MWPDRVSNPGLLVHESDALPTALRGPAMCVWGGGGNLYSHVSGMKFYFQKNHSHFFPEAKTTTCMGKSYHTFRVAEQTFIPTYMHQKIL